MNINKDNYEAFFLDYHEGNLTPQQVADLLLFIEQYPELKDEFESFENLTLDDLSKISFEDKASLKKESTIENKEAYFIRSVENTLTPAEKNLLEDFIKQYPQFLPELELFRKTKVFADTSIVFENKHSLKRVAESTPSPTGEGWDEVLIASMEGLLTKQETVFLNQQLAVDAEMQHSFNLFKQTKLVVDNTIVFENKEELKKKERKIIPLYYYVAAAASIALLIGLFFTLGNKDKNEPQFAKDDKIQDIKIKTPDTRPENRDVVIPNKDLSVQLSDLRVGVYPEQGQGVVKKNHTAKKKKTFTKKDSLLAPVENNEQAPIINIAENKPEPGINNEQPIANSQPETNKGQPAIASISNKTDSKRSNEEFLSLRELAAEKIKEKTLDEKTMAVQKENGRSKRFSGWDLAQIVTRGISKLTGRNLEIKPTYNDEGDVMAYALGNNLQIARK